jgi:N-succinyldiaminopimelate aminotransferase
MDQSKTNAINDVAELAAFRPVPRTGVIYVTVEAQKRGFSLDDPGWCNLGQGQPDTGSLPGAPKRVTSIDVRESDLDYAPVPGLWELREAVAALYNGLFRRGMKSQYSAENVGIAGGGRVAVMRACAAIAPIHLGHFLPDYTAYEELLDVFRRFLPIPILLDPKQGYEFTSEDLEKEILGRGLSSPDGSTRRGSPTARSCSTSSIRTTYGTVTKQSSAQRSTSRTSTKIQSCCSTGSRRTGATLDSE